MTLRRPREAAVAVRAMVEARCHPTSTETVKTLNRHRRRCLSPASSGDQRSASPPRIRGRRPPMDELVGDDVATPRRPENVAAERVNRGPSCQAPRRAARPSRRRAATLRSGGGTPTPRQSSDAAPPAQEPRQRLPHRPSSVRLSRTCVGPSASTRCWAGSTHEAVHRSHQPAHEEPNAAPDDRRPSTATRPGYEGAGDPVGEALGHALAGSFGLIVDHLAARR